MGVRLERIVSTFYFNNFLILPAAKITKPPAATAVLTDFSVKSLLCLLCSHKIWIFYRKLLSYISAKNILYLPYSSPISLSIFLFSTLVSSLSILIEIFWEISLNRPSFPECALSIRHATDLPVSSTFLSSV